MDRNRPGGLISGLVVVVLLGATIAWAFLGQRDLLRRPGLDPRDRAAQRDPAALRSQFDVGRFVGAITFSPDGDMLAVDTTHTLGIWQVDDGRLGQMLGAAEEDEHFRPGAITWSPDGTYLAAGEPDTTVSIWNTGDGTLVANLAGHTGPVLDLAWSPDGTLLGPQVPTGRSGSGACRSLSCIARFKGMPISSGAWRSVLTG
jgi:WD40 repeat protein